MDMRSLCLRMRSEQDHPHRSTERSRRTPRLGRPLRRCPLHRPHRRGGGLWRIPWLVGFVYPLQLGVDGVGEEG